MPKFTILRKIDPPEKCYLSEVLNWLAFGRFPEVAFVLEEPWTISEGTRIFYGAPDPIGEELSEEECLFASLPCDPRTKFRLEDRETISPDRCRELINLARSLDPPDEEQVSKCEEALRESIQYEETLKDWLPKYQNYIDEFRNEICLDLRRGNLSAYGIELPHSNFEKVKDILIAQEISLCDLSARQVPKMEWISSGINWIDSTLTNGDNFFVRIYVLVDDMLKRYPPRNIIKKDQLRTFGTRYAIATSRVAQNVTSKSVGGRPPFQWESFHVEVARKFRDGEMPDKKEAAIEELQQWFEKFHGMRPSRSIVGEKLKPYFDGLMKKGQKPIKP